MLGGLGQDYNPYGTPDERGDVAKAMEEMKQSKYDTDGTACATHRSAPSMP